MLSTTARAKARAARKAKDAGKEGGAEAMETDKPAAGEAAAEGAAAAGEGGKAEGGEGGKDKAEGEGAKKEPEPTSFTGGCGWQRGGVALLAWVAEGGGAPAPAPAHSDVCIDPCASLVAYLCLPHMPKSAVDNPARVAPGQRKYIAFPDGQRFAPIRPAPSGARVRCTAGYALWAGCCGVATCQHAACCSGWQLARHMLHCDSDSP